MISHSVEGVYYFMLDYEDDLPVAPVGSRARRRWPTGSYPPGGSRSSDQYVMTPDGWVTVIEPADKPESIRWNELFEALGRIEKRLDDMGA